MSRRYNSDPEGLAVALAGRVDLLETETRKTSQDLTALGRGVSQLTAQIRDLTSRDAASADPEAVGDEEQPQPDWMTVDDVGTARAWLGGLEDWLTDVAGHHGLSPTAPCWPLHPDVVALLLALQTERDVAYDGERPTPVTEWLTRWLPTASTAIETALASCVAERGHRHAGHTYDSSDLDPGTAAAWWALDRHHLPAVEALGLTRLT